MRIILGGAWKNRAKLFKRFSMTRKSEYTEEVRDVFGKNALIDWGSGEVTCGERTPIPMAEVISK